VVIAADRPPSDLESLDDRVYRASRAAWCRDGIAWRRIAARVSNSCRGRAASSTFDVPAPVLDPGCHPWRASRAYQPYGSQHQCPMVTQMAGAGARLGPSAEPATTSRTFSGWSPTNVRCPICNPAPDCNRAPRQSRCIWQDADAALAARNRPPVRRTRPHHGAARRADRRWSKDVVSPKRLIAETSLRNECPRSSARPGRRTWRCFQATTWCVRCAVRPTAGERLRPSTPRVGGPGARPERRENAGFSRKTWGTA
jgi:hypothetical protein